MIERIEADYAVVGGGSAGAVVAGRLAERGADVVLVEAGPDYGSLASGGWPPELVDARMLATTHDWNYSGGRWTFSRARVIGGCSSHNGAIAAVGHSTDYDSWGLPGWSADDVRPVFDTVIGRMRVRAYERSEAVPFHEECMQVATAFGWNIASDLCELDANESFGMETVNVHGTTRWNTAFAYLDPVRETSGLRILDRTLVDRITSGASGAVIHGSSDHRVEVHATKVVLAAGTYGTPAILQRSGVGDPDQLRSVGIAPIAASLNVGANLHDHPLVHSDRAIGADLQVHLDATAAAGFLPEEQTLGKFASSLSVDGLYDMHLFPVCASDQTSELNGRVAVEVACMKPRSRGRVDVVSADPLAPPLIDHRYLADQEGHDLAVLREGLKIAERMLDHPILAGLLGERVTDTASDEAIRSEVAHYYHPVGTCAMGLGEDAVCDQRGRVRGLENVVIADASMIPEIPRANTNLPAIMVGEQIARWI